jgi:adenylate cyclase
VEPSAEDVRRQLDRILASDGFAKADRMAGFLRYVVERSLAGEEDQVKEYAIGVDVFGRDADYDPRLDSIVRVEARRLRAKVDEYYAGPGTADPVRIQMRRGSYVPVFVIRPVDTDATVPLPNTTPARPSRGRGWQVAVGLAIAALLLVTLAARQSGMWATMTHPAPAVSIAVLPFTEYSTDPESRLLAARLTDGVTSELARIGTLGVASHTSALQFADGPRRPLREIARTLDVDVIMEGSVRKTGSRIAVGVRLIDVATDRKVWVRDFVGDAGDPSDLERRIATAAAPAALGARTPR